MGTQGGGAEGGGGFGGIEGGGGGEGGFVGLSSGGGMGGGGDGGKRGHGGGGEGGGGGGVGSGDGGGGDGGGVSGGVSGGGDGGKVISSLTYMPSESTAPAPVVSSPTLSSTSKVLEVAAKPQIAAFLRFARLLPFFCLRFFWPLSISTTSYDVVFGIRLIRLLSAQRTGIPW